MCAQFTKLVFRTGIATLFLCGICFADMTEGTWILTESSEFTDGLNYGTVKIKANDVTGKVKFTITAATDPYLSTGCNFGLDRFGFNFAGTSAFTSNLLGIGWWMMKNKTLDGFGQFELVPTDLIFVRQQPLAFTLTLANPAQAVVDNFAVSYPGTTGNFFAAHIGGFRMYDQQCLPDCHWVSGGVPIPAPHAALLAAIGLGMIRWVKMRSDEKRANS